MDILIGIDSILQLEREVFVEKVGLQKRLQQNFLTSFNYWLWRKCGKKAVETGADSCLCGDHSKEPLSHMLYVNPAAFLLTCEPSPL